MILFIDNYDSFVYNLARYFEVLGYETVIYRNNKICLQKILQINPSHIVISPGPCTPQEAGISIDVIKYFSDKIPILGVCLGHQAIGAAFGAQIVKAKYPMHGSGSNIEHNGYSIFNNIPNPFFVGRYHSLIISNTQFPKCLEVLARSSENEIMAIKHNTLPVFGVQFHPESILTEHGSQILKNFVNT